MNVYAFDVDHTLEVSDGPVTLKMLMDLRVEGHIVGICGNWGLFAQRVPGWQHLISFFNCNVDKVAYLRHFRQYIAADDYVLVGNVGPIDSVVFGQPKTGESDDLGASVYAGGWRFIKEHDFAKGNR